jgi:hypothetical protein
MIGFIDSFFYILSQPQSIFSRNLLPCLLRTCSILVLVYDWLSDWLLTWNSAIYSLRGDPMENTVSQQVAGQFSAPLPRNGRRIFPRYFSAGRCLASCFLSMSIMRHNIHKNMLNKGHLTRDILVRAPSLRTHTERLFHSDPRPAREGR